MGMSDRPLDIAVLAVYIAAVVAFGCWFVRKSGTTKGFMIAGGALPAWAVGLSLFGTFLSSNTFIGVPGKAFGGNWNAFVFSLSIPIAAWIGVKYFIPFYRRSGEISAYHHLEHRFGPWARTYAVICYLLTQVARVATIMLGVSLALHTLTGWSVIGIILVTGVLVTLYTLLGGIEAVIWTDVIQSIVLSLGALLVVGLLLAGHPDGPGGAIAFASEHGKFSLGGFGPSLQTSTVWVVLIYGIFINLNNFGIDQNYVQRYHTASSARAAAKSLWMGAILYVPVSLVFFFIGSLLFSYYTAQPELLAKLQTEATTNPSDQAFPHFIANFMPPGVSGIILAALLAAAMSTIDTSLNSSATITLTDIYKRYVRPQADEAHSMRVLHVATVIWGVIGTSAAIAMVGRDILDTWWKLSGMFAGGMLGLFLLGLISRRAGNAAAATGVVLGLLVIFWMSFSPESALPEVLHSPFHSNMVIVVGTLTIFLVGLCIGKCCGNRKWTRMDAN